MGDLRNRLDRKNELRLYEWMRDEANYGKLANKTIPEGAAFVSQQLDLRVSSSVLVSLVQAMDLKPFWQQKPARVNTNGVQRTLEFDPVSMFMPKVEEAVRPLHDKMRNQGKRLDHQAKSLNQLKAVCQNLVLRIEGMEASNGNGRKQAGKLNGGPVVMDGSEKRE